LWGCSPIKGDAHEESLGSIWNIPSSLPLSKCAIDENFEAPLPPPISYNQKSQPQLIRPQDIGSVMSGMASNNNCNNNSNNNGHNNHNNNHNNNNNNVSNKVKEPVGALWAHPTPPNLPMTLQAQNYNLLSTNSKFKPSSGGLMNGSAHNNGFMNSTSNASSAAYNTQLFSDEFLSYLNMIN
jgi:hypothetical protein